MHHTLLPAFSKATLAVALEAAFFAVCGTLAAILAAHPAIPADIKRGAGLLSALFFIGLGIMIWGAVR